MSYEDWLRQNGIMKREDWLQGTQWIGGSPGFSAGSVDHMTKHYMGGNNINCDNIPQLLRNMQNDYRKNRGYDLGYSFGTDQQGGKYEIRGLRVRAASDGSTNTNASTVSVLGMSPNMGDPMSGQMELADQELMAAVRQYCPGAQHWIGHRDAFGTSCPGDPWYSKVQAGALEPGSGPVVPTPQPPSNGDEDMPIGPMLFFADQGNVGHDSEGQPFTVRTSGTWFKASMNGQSYVWVRAKDVDDVKAQARQVGQDENAVGPVANLDAFGVLVGEKPS